MYLRVLSGIAVLVAIYLWRVNRMLHSTPDEALRLVQPAWTKDEIETAYRKVQADPIDVKPFLFDRTGRRYIVVGGSGLVGGWIVQHLLMRGEDPAAILILDLNPPKRKEILDKNINFVQIDITNAAGVLQAFQAPWPEHVKSSPLTVFHCAAYISVIERTHDFSSTLEQINIHGTSNVIKAAQAVGATILVSTSSVTTGLLPPSYFPWPWQRIPTNYWQLLPNANRDPLIRQLNEYSSCYTWSKAHAENLVRTANNPTQNFLTGCLRPGQTLYGHGGANPWSISWNYLNRGGAPSWIHHIVVNLVHAENVSVGHLAFENALLKPDGAAKAGGKAYAVTDPNPPITYGHFYRALSTLAHPLRPTKFPEISTLPIVLLAYVLEAYRLLRVRVPYLDLLPDLRGDIRTIQPAMLRMCTLHTVYTDTAAQEEIGYRAPIGTLEGVALSVLDWNRGVEEEARRKVEKGKEEEVVVQTPSVVPKGPTA